MENQESLGSARGFGGRGRPPTRKPYGIRRQNHDGPPPSSRRPEDPGRRRSNAMCGNSIVGTIPDTRAAEPELYMKYDFNSRKFDTSSLVINFVRQEILNGLAENQIMMIQGFTGCGKTTQVPQFILEDAKETGANCQIVVTQPRRIAAISVANRVVAERGWQIGDLVGYQVGMNKATTPDTRLTYVTTGVLLQSLINQKNLKKYTHIIIDEVHERDLETDLLLLVINKIMREEKNKDTKIILMSATLTAKKFIKYFPKWCKEAVKVEVANPPSFPIKEYYLEDSAYTVGFEGFNMEGMEEPKCYQECFEIAAKIIEGLDDIETNNAVRENTDVAEHGAVLVFLPGLLEIETFFKILTEISDKLRDTKPQILQWLILPLHSSITNEEQQRVFFKPQEGFRKIILATNIAESSITVPDIKYVIDFCLTKNLSCDPTTNYTCLRLDWASKNQCIQRRGRCGRVSPGVVYKMVPRKFYDTLEQEAMPEMLRSSLESVVLQVKLLDLGNPKDTLRMAVDPPDEVNISRAVANLKEIGALTINMGKEFDPYDGVLTFIGRVLAHLPIDIRLGRLILLGYAFDCLEEAVIIAAGLSVKSPFAYPYTKRLEAYLSKMCWSYQSFSDCLALLNLYLNWHRRHSQRDFHSFADEKHWAKNYFVQVTSLREMKLLVEELLKRLAKFGIDLSSQNYSKEEQQLLLKITIAGAFYPNYFIRTRPDEKDYRKEINRELAGQDAKKSVVLQGFPMGQPGDLYKKQIADAVQYEYCFPSVVVHGSRVIVTFDSRGSCIGQISGAVYRSIKLRQLRHLITLHTPSYEDAHRMVAAEKSKLDHQRRSPDYVSCPQQVAMPDLQTTQFQAIVTHIETPSEFYVVMKRDEKARRDLADLMAEHAKTLRPIVWKRSMISQFCIVDFRGVYFRARIESGRDEKGRVTVYLLDKGVTMTVDGDKILMSDKLIGEKIHKNPPALAIKCKLSNVQASFRTGMVWSDNALKVFDDYCSKNHSQVIMEIYSVVDREVTGVLTNSDNPDAKSINKILIEKRLAEDCNEPQVSKENHDIRERVKTETRADALRKYNISEERQNEGFAPQLMVEPPREGPNVQNTATLRGPYSPLEMNFSSMCRSAHLKQVVTDGSSINSVVLDQDPTVPTSRLMVAANVAIAARSGNIMARETSLMPPIPGLCSLMAMLFCPKLEFRVDQNYTKYTGCVTGLGIDPNDEKMGSIYPDHDMEIVFDTVIDDKDIEMINSVRSQLNAILGKDSTSTTTDDNKERERRANLNSERSKMRQMTLDLLDRQRDFVAEDWPEESHRWNIINPKTLKYCVEYERDKENVFPLHPVVNLTGIKGGTPDFVIKRLQSQSSEQGADTVKSSEYVWED